MRLIQRYDDLYGIEDARVERSHQSRLVVAIKVLIRSVKTNMRLDEAGVDLPWLAKDRVPVKGIEATIVKPARIVQSQFRDPRTGQTRDQIVMTISFPDDTGRETVWNFACPSSSLREISLEWGQEMDDWNGGVLLISTEVIKEGLLMGKSVFVAKPVRAPPVVETVSEKRGVASAKRK